MIEERAAIIHDWFQGFHGSERVVDAMRTGLFAPTNPPEVFTFHAARDLLPQELASSIVRESRLAGLPGIRQRGHDPGRWRYLLPYMPRYFDRLDLSQYGLVISSSHAFAARVRPAPGALHACYCYTPLRYAWLETTDFGRVSGFRGLLFRSFGPRLRRLDFDSSQRPDGYVAISEVVRDRIQRIYGREAHVIYPPVEVDELAAGADKDPKRFLWVGRLVPYKRPELVVEAFRELPYRLTMVGVGPLERRLRQTLPSNVELRGWLAREELLQLYANAGGFVHVGEEDFGIAMVEALASGTPVVALGRGGAAEIIRNGLDGLLVQQATAESVRNAVHRLVDRDWDTQTLILRARNFSRQRFLERFETYLASLAAGGKERPTPSST